MRSAMPRVAVTREEDGEGPLTRALLGYGLEPVACPVVVHLPSPEPEALRRAIAELDRYDWIVVSSARAVAALALGRAPLSLPRRPRWAAVGGASSTALGRHGVRAAVVPADSGSQALLAELLGADNWTGRRVLVPRAAGGRLEVAAALRALGAAVTEVAAYATVPRPREGIRAAWQAAAADGVILASPSAARALVRAVGAPAIQQLTAVVAIGGTTAEALRDLAVSPRIAPRAEFAAAAELCAHLLGTFTEQTC